MDHLNIDQLIDVFNSLQIKYNEAQEEIKLLAKINAENIIVIEDLNLKIESLENQIQHDECWKCKDETHWT